MFKSRLIPLFIFLLFAIQSKAQVFDPSELDDIVRMEANRWHVDLRKTDGVYNGDTYDWKFASCIWEIDPWLKYISGTVTHTIELLTPQTSITFDFNENMDVNEVLVDGESASFSFPDSYTLEVIFAAEEPIGEMLVEISYEGEPVSEGRSSFNQSFHDIDKPEIWTLSEPYGSKDWWPCKHTLKDKLDSVFIEITVPEGNKAGSNGKLLYETDNGDGTISFGWKHRYPIPAYLVSLAVTNYAEFSQYVEVDDTQIHILNYIYPERLETEMGRGEATPDLMVLFSELFGLYPYADEKYGHAQASIPGGMEHTTMSTMTNLIFGLNAHELAHQWFGDKVTCGSWADIWLNEGFATYATGLSYEHIGEPGSWDNWKTNMIGQVTSKPDGSVYVEDTLDRDRTFDGRLTYRKGSGVLHMLRWKVGDEAFFGGMQSYLEDTDLAFNFVYTPDFQSHMEMASGADLSKYFEDWIYKEGYPNYEVVWWPAETGIAIQLNQSPSHESVGFFELPVELEIRGIGQDTVLTLNNTYNGQIFLVNPGFDVNDITFDPNYWLIAKSTVRIDLENDYTDFLVIPNPATDVIRVSILNPNFRADRVEIIDSQGKILDTEIPINEIRGGFEWNVSHLAPGHYIIRMMSGVHAKSIPFVKI